MESGVDHFACTPSSGTLDGFASRVSNHAETISITYAPPSDGFFETTLVLKGGLGEEEKRIRIFGEGTYDEAGGHRD